MCLKCDEHDTASNHNVYIQLYRRNWMQCKSIAIIHGNSQGNGPSSFSIQTWGTRNSSWYGMQRLVTRSFDVFFDLPLNLQLSKQWRRWWFDTLPRSLWRHYNVVDVGATIQVSLLYDATCVIVWACVRKRILKIPLCFACMNWFVL